jgi:hypothetical protein
VASFDLQIDGRGIDNGDEHTDTLSTSCHTTVDRCGGLGVASVDLVPGVATEVHRFFDKAVECLEAGGSARSEALRVMATPEGAMLLATAKGDASVSDVATMGLL